jgi:hypothetical protein
VVAVRVSASGGGGSLEASSSILAAQIGASKTITIGQGGTGGVSSTGGAGGNGYFNGAAGTNTAGNQIAGGGGGGCTGSASGTSGGSGASFGGVTTVGVAGTSSGSNQAGGASGSGAAGGSSAPGNGSLYGAGGGSVGSGAGQAGNGAQGEVIVVSYVLSSSYFQVGLNSTGNPTPVFQFDNYGHEVTSGVAPSFTCGTGASIAGNDMLGRVYVGTSPGTSCKITFDNPWMNPPICSANSETPTYRTLTSSSTPIAVTITATSTMSGAFTYQCGGYQ